MNLHDFVFSEEKRIRYRRHIIFWLVWLFYFNATFFFKQQAFVRGDLLLWLFLLLIKSSLVLLSHAFLCYVTVYLLLPLFLLKGRHFSFVGILLAAGTLAISWTYVCYSLVFPLLDNFFHSVVVTTRFLLWNSITTGFLSSLKLVAVAILLKLLKSWWLKQNENLELEKEKVETELQLLKAQIHPDFLFSSLDKIYYYTLNDASKAASLLLKLSDLLSYILYECNQPLVPLTKEVQMLRNYLELEIKRLGEKLDVDVQLIGDPGNKLIAPLLLLPFVENSFQFCEDNRLEKYWINLDLRVHGNAFSMKLINGKYSSDQFAGETVMTGLMLIQKRLGMLYENAHEMKISDEGDFMITYLKIELNDPYELMANDMPDFKTGKKALESYAS